MASIDPIGRAFQRAIEERVFPGAVLLVRCKGTLSYQGAFGSLGSLSSDASVSLETIYDLASLTKVLATTSAILVLVQEGRLNLDTVVGSLLPECQQSPISRVPIHQLLSHSSGLPAWKSLDAYLRTRDRESVDSWDREKKREVIIESISQEVLLAPPGTEAVYSDLGFILLGFVVERVTGRLLSDFCHQLYYQLKASPLAYLPTGLEEVARPSHWPNIAPTEYDERRGRVLQGEVHDANAYQLDGIGGHAGLFGSAAAVLAVSGCWLDSFHGRDSMFSSDITKKFVAPQERVPGSSWALGWDRPSHPSSSGTFFSPQSFGHLGFTGTSLWVDPVAELEVVLLSNRVYYGSNNIPIRRFRREIHDLVWKEVMG